MDFEAIFRWLCALPCRSGGTPLHSEETGEQLQLDLELLTVNLFCELILLLGMAVPLQLG
ncbi:MAG: hypothetical protein GY718_01820 [Lentisphaerae bacterium]|nr:hypothetical protein [Lentisphaerota bacterium]